MTSSPYIPSTPTRASHLALAALASLALLAVACEQRSTDEQPPPNMQRGTVERVTSVDIDWRHDHDAALAAARAAGKPVIIDFFADWCAPCIELDEALADARVTELVNAHFVAIKMDASESTEAVRPHMDRYGVEAFPVLLFLDAEGQVLDAPRFDDAVSPEGLLDALRRVAPDAAAP